MNIIIIGTAYPYRGGLAAYNERLARQFADEENSVSVMTFTLQYPGFLFPGKSQFLEGPPPKGVNIERCINSINPFNWLSLGYRLKKTKPDLIIFKYWLPFMAPCFGTISRIARHNGHSKVICIFDNVIPHERRRGDRLLTKYFISSIDGAVVMSKSVLSDLKLFRKDIPAKLNPHPLFDNFGPSVPRNEALDKVGLDASFNWMLFFGFIRAYKGLDLLLEAFADIRIRNRDLKLVVAGEFYEDDRPYRDLVKELNLENDIVFFDRFINDNEVKYFFSAADLVIQPYRDATQSGVTQIAYHFQKPMIVTDVGGLREIVPDGKCGYVVKPSPQDIANAIDNCYRNNMLKTFEENIKIEKTKYSWSMMSESVIEVFNKTNSDDHKK